MGNSFILAGFRWWPGLIFGFAKQSQSLPGELSRGVQPFCFSFRRMPVDFVGWLLGLAGSANQIAVPNFHQIPANQACLGSQQVTSELSI